MSDYDSLTDLSQCCQCNGHNPDFGCACTCHRQDDCEYWETAAYVWLFDAPDAAAREVAWARFCEAFPEHSNETAEEFWARIQETEWCHKNKKHYRHHHWEYEDDWTDEYTDPSGEHEEFYKSLEEYDENEDDGVYTTRYEQEVVDDTENISDTGEFKREHVFDETDDTSVEDENADDPFEHKRTHHSHLDDALDVDDEALEPGDTRPLGDDGPDPVPDPLDSNAPPKKRRKRRKK